MSAAGNPASLRRRATAFAAVVVLPTESVVLISISSLKIAWLNCRVALSSVAAETTAAASNSSPTTRMAAFYGSAT
jgi:hypothetical protein